MSKGIILLSIFILFLGCTNSKKVIEKFEISENPIVNEEKSKYRYTKETIFNKSFYFELLKKYYISNMDQVEFLINFFNQDELSEYIKILEIEASITDIEFLNKFPNLEGLNFDKMKKNIDLSPISNLKKLKRLSFSYSEIDDLSPITQLENLESMYLLRNKFKNMNPIYEIKNLKYLRFVFQDIVDMTNINKLQNLEYLEITFHWDYNLNKVINLNNLINLNKLKKLKIVNTIYNDVSPLIKLNSLEYLETDYDRSVDYTILVKSKSLKEIYFLSMISSDDIDDFHKNKIRIFENNGISIGIAMYE